MIARPTVVSSAQVEKYHTNKEGAAKDQNYYSAENDNLGVWFGKGAELAGFKGAVSEADLKNALWGRGKDGQELLKENQIYTDEKGNRKRAAYDMPYSPPNSISIVVEMLKANGMDAEADKIVDIFTRRVDESLERFEKEALVKWRNDDVTERVNTGNLVIAKFTHDVARPVVNNETGEQTVDPRLHIHPVIMNMSYDKETDKWRTIESEFLMKNWMKEGVRFRSQLAKDFKDMGFDIEVTDAKKGFWEIRDVEDAVRDEFKKRSEQINNPEKITELKKKYPHKTESEIKQLLAYSTRNFKGDIDREAVRQHNKSRAEQAGFRKEHLLEIASRIKNGSVKEINAAPTGDEMAKALKVMESAVEIHSNSDSVAKINDIRTTAEKLGMAEGIGAKAYDEAFKSMFGRKDDLKTISLDGEHITTSLNLRLERKLISGVKDRKGSINSNMDKKQAEALLTAYSDAKKAKTGHGLSHTQLGAAVHMMSSKDGIIGVQGDAGTGKTTVLKALHELDKNNDYIGLSYTGRAAEEIEKKTRREDKKAALSEKAMSESSIKSDTIAGFLTRIEKGVLRPEDVMNKKIVVDEASMVSTQDLFKLAEISKRANSQLILIGDTKQFQAISAGSPFSMLQEHGLETRKMNEVIRQKTPDMKEAVKYLNKDMDAAKALNYLDKKGKVTELAALKDKDYGEISNEEKQDIVVAAIVNEWKKQKSNYKQGLNPQEKEAFIAGNESIDLPILTSTNDLKDIANYELRKVEQEEGRVAKDDENFTVRESKGLMEVERAFAASYEGVTDISIQKDFGKFKVGDELKLVGRDPKTNTVKVKDSGGQEHTIKLDEAKNFLKINAYKRKKIDLSTGENIVFQKNDKKIGVKNGTKGKVLSKDKDGNFSVEIAEDKHRRTVQFNMNDYNYVDHGYATTLHKSQGGTYDRGVVYMDPKMQSFNSFYVAVTRFEKDVKIVTDSKEKLARSVIKDQKKENAVTFKNSLLRMEERELQRDGEKELKAHKSQVAERTMNVSRRGKGR